MDRSRVLLLDHDRKFLDRLSGALSRDGVAPIEVASSTDAGAVSKTPECDALVCIINRPEEVQVLERLKEARGNVPVIALLRSGETELADRVRAAGVDSILFKDRDLGALAPLLRSILENLFLAKRSEALSAEVLSRARTLSGLIVESRRILRAGGMKALSAHSVLVVDADANIGSMVELALERADFRCPHVARSVDEAVAYLSGLPPFEDRRRYPLPFLVFLHLHLPATPGIELLRWMRSHEDFKQTIILVNIDTATPDDVRGAYEWGANSVLARPDTPEGWRELVAAVKSFWVRTNV